MLELSKEHRDEYIEALEIAIYTLNVYKGNIYNGHQEECKSASNSLQKLKEILINKSK